MSFGRIRPCKQLHPQFGEDLGGQALGLGLGGLDLRAISLVYRRAHDERLTAGGDLAAYQVLGALATGIVADRARLYRLPAPRHLVQHHDVEVAVVGERERPRDRGGGHDEDVDVAAALALQRHPLMQPEPVLLVDHREREVVEGDTLLDERVRAHDEVDRPVGDPLRMRSLSLPRTPPDRSA